MFRLTSFVALLSLAASCSTLPAQDGSRPAGAGVDAAATAIQRYAREDAGDPRLALPEDIDRALQTDELVLSCPTGTRDSFSRFARDWVGVRRLDLDADGRLDWIVNGRHECLQQPYAGYWWLYRETLGGRELLLRGAPATTLVVLASRSHGFHDLEARVVNGRGAELVESYRYDGKEEYRPTLVGRSDADP